MAKITTKGYTIDGQYKCFEVHYTQKNGFILKDFPGDVWKLGTEHSRPPHFGSETELYTAVFHALLSYHEKKKTQKKVIRVELKLGIHYLSNRTGRGSYEGHKAGIGYDFMAKVSELSFPTYGIELDYMICFLVEDNGAKLFRANDDGTVGGKLNVTPKREIIIDYTPERELFMQTAMGSIEKLAEMLISFFNKEDSELTQLIDSKGATLFLNQTTKALLP